MNTMLEKAKKLPLVWKIIWTLVLSVLWILIASNFDIETQVNWILSTLVIAGISSVFFGFNTKLSKEDGNETSIEEKDNS